MNAPKPLPPTDRSLSGIAIRQKTDVEALTDSIERHAREGNIALWCVVELLPVLKPHHWAAYARDARIPYPSDATIQAAQTLYRERIGYQSPTCVAPPAHSRDAQTLPGIAAPEIVR